MIHKLQNAYQNGIRWSLAGSTASALFQFAQMAVFARLAGPEAAGDYALAATFISFLTPVAEAGLSQAVVQASHIQERQLATLTWVNWALGALIFTLLYISGPVLSQWFGRPELPGLLLVMGASLLLTPFGAQYSALLTREMQFGQSAKIEILSWIISFIGTVWLACLGEGAWAMAIGFLLRNIVATLGCVWLGRQMLAVNLFQTAKIAEISPMLRFGAFELSSRWADFFSNYLDKLIIAKWLGPAALGYYNLAFTFLMLPTARLAYMITRVSFPVFARIRHEPVLIQAFFERIAREIILLLFPVYLIMVLFSNEMVLLCFGEKWLPAAPLFVVLGIAGLIRTLCAPFPQMVKGLGKPQFWLAWMIIFSTALGLSLVICLSMEPSALSAAWSRTFTKILVEIALLWGLAKWCGLDFAPVLRFAGKVLLLLMPVIASTYLAGSIVEHFWISTGLKSTVFLSGLFVVYRFTGLQEAVQKLVQNFSRPAS